MPMIYLAYFANYTKFRVHEWLYLSWNDRCVPMINGNNGCIDHSVSAIYQFAYTIITNHTSQYGQIKGMFTGHISYLSPDLVRQFYDLLTHQWTIPCELIVTATAIARQNIWMIFKCMCEKYIQSFLYETRKNVVYTRTYRWPSGLLMVRAHARMRTNIQTNEVISIVLCGR